MAMMSPASKREEPPIRLLITSIGSLVAQNVLDALEARRDGVYIIGTNSRSDDPGIFRADKAYLLEPTNRSLPIFLRRLEEIIEMESPALVIPGRDDDVAALAHLRQDRPKWADRLLCGAPHLADMMLDKWLTYQFALRHQLPFADTAIADADNGYASIHRLAKAHGFPIIAKPRSGFGSNDVFLIANERQLEHAIGLTGYVFQHYLGGGQALSSLQQDISLRGVPLFFSLEEDKYSLQTMIFADGSVGNIFSTLNRMVMGKSVSVEAVDDPALMDIAGSYVHTLAMEGWVGPVNIQCARLPERGYGVYELNGRFTGATFARYLLGFDEVGLALERFAGAPTISGVAFEERAVKATKTTMCRPLCPSDVECLQSEGVWISAKGSGR